MKRSLSTMLVVLALALGICVSGMLLIRHVALEMEEMRVNAVKLLEAGKTDEADEQITQMADMWAWHEPLLETISPHETLHAVTELITEADANLTVGDIDDLHRSMMLLELAIEHLFIEEQFMISNIF